jgi:hypothetical protein
MGGATPQPPRPAALSTHLGHTQIIVQQGE